MSARIARPQAPCSLAYAKVNENNLKFPDQNIMLTSPMDVRRVGVCLKEVAFLNSFQPWVTSILLSPCCFEFSITRVHVLSIFSRQEMGNRSIYSPHKIVFHELFSKRIYPQNRFYPEQYFFPTNQFYHLNRFVFSAKWLLWWTKQILIPFYLPSNDFQFLSIHKTTSKFAPDRKLLAKTL